MEKCQRKSKVLKSNKRRQKKDDQPNNAGRDLPEITEDSKMIRKAVEVNAKTSKRKRKCCLSGEKQSESTTSVPAAKYIPKFKKKNVKGCKETTDTPVAIKRIREEMEDEIESPVSNDIKRPMNVQDNKTNRGPNGSTNIKERKIEENIKNTALVSTNPERSADEQDKQIVKGSKESTDINVDKPVAQERKIAENTKNPALMPTNVEMSIDDQDKQIVKGSKESADINVDNPVVQERTIEENTKNAALMSTNVVTSADEQDKQIVKGSKESTDIKVDKPVEKERKITENTKNAALMSTNVEMSIDDQDKQIVKGSKESADINVDNPVVQERTIEENTKNAALMSTNVATLSDEQDKQIVKGSKESTDIKVDKPVEKERKIAENTKNAALMSTNVEMSIDDQDKQIVKGSKESADINVDKPVEKERKVEENTKNAALVSNDVVTSADEQDKQIVKGSKESTDINVDKPVAQERKIAENTKNPALMSTNVVTSADEQDKQIVKGSKESTDIKVDKPVEKERKIAENTKNAALMSTNVEMSIDEQDKQIVKGSKESTDINVDNPVVQERTIEENTKNAALMSTNVVTSADEQDKQIVKGSKESTDIKVDKPVEKERKITENTKNPALMPTNVVTSADEQDKQIVKGSKGSTDIKVDKPVEKERKIAENTKNPALMSTNVEILLDEQDKQIVKGSKESTDIYVDKPMEKEIKIKQSIKNAALVSNDVEMSLDLQDRKTVKEYIGSTDTRVDNHAEIGGKQNKIKAKIEMEMPLKVHDKNVDNGEEVNDRIVPTLMLDDVEMPLKVQKDKNIGRTANTDIVTQIGKECLDHEMNTLSEVNNNNLQTESMNTISRETHCTVQQKKNTGTPDEDHLTNSSSSPHVIVARELLKLANNIQGRINEDVFDCSMQGVVNSNHNISNIVAGHESVEVKVNDEPKLAPSDLELVSSDIDEQITQTNILKIKSGVEMEPSGAICDASLMSECSVTQDLPGIGDETMADDQDVSISEISKPMEPLGTEEQVTNMSGIYVKSLSKCADDDLSPSTDVQDIQTMYTEDNMINNISSNIYQITPSGVTDDVVLNPVDTTGTTTTTLHSTGTKSNMKYVAKDQIINSLSLEMSHISGVFGDQATNTVIGKACIQVQDKETNMVSDDQMITDSSSAVVATPCDVAIGQSPVEANDDDTNDVKSIQNTKINKKIFVEDQMIILPSVTKTVSVSLAAEVKVEKTPPHKLTMDTEEKILNNESTQEAVRSLHVETNQAQNNSSSHEGAESTSKIKSPTEVNHKDVDILRQKRLNEDNSSHLQQIDGEMLDITDSQICQMEMEYSTLEDYSDNAKTNRRKRPDEKFYRLLQEKKNEGSRQITGVIRDLHKFNTWLTGISQQISQSKRMERQSYVKSKQTNSASKYSSKQ